MSEPAVPASFPLPSSFDPVRLRADLARVGPEAWSPHYIAAHFGVQFRAEERTQLQEAARFDSKNPGRLFRGPETDRRDG